MPVTKHTTDDTFAADVLASDKPVLVDFWAPWCGPCRMVAPVLDEIIDAHGDKIDIVKVNVDENLKIAMEYKITSIPALKVFKNGEVALSIIGAKPRPALEADLAEFIA